jgi:phage terminase large subunit-like protein
MAPAVDALETSVLERRLAHDGNPVLTFCMLNAHAQMDAAGNRKLDKAATRFRIDAAVALTIALGCKARDAAAEPDEGPSIYEILAARRKAEAAGQGVVG